MLEAPIVHWYQGGTIKCMAVRDVGVSMAGKRWGCKYGRQEMGM